MLAGGRGRGSAGRGKAGAMSAEHLNQPADATSTPAHEGAAPAAHRPLNTLPEAQHGLSPDASLDELCSDASDILEELPLAERLAEKQHQRMLAEAATRPGAEPAAASGQQHKSPLADTSAARPATASAAAVQGQTLLADTPAAKSGVATAADAAAAAAAPRVAKRSSWVRPRLPQPAVAAGPAEPSPVELQPQQNVITNRADINSLSRVADSNAQVESAAQAVSVKAELLTESGQPARPAGTPRATVTHDASGPQHAGEHSQPSHMAFLIDIDDSPVPAGSSAHEAQVNADQHDPMMDAPQQARQEPSWQPHSAPYVSIMGLSHSHGQDAGGTSDASASGIMYQDPAQRTVRPSGLGSPSLGPLPADALTVPDTPPYSSTSQGGSPKAGPRPGPTWLSPLLARHQPGQGRQYSPSMLGRPHGMHMSTNTVEASASVQLTPGVVQSVQVHGAMPAASTLLPLPSPPCIKLAPVSAAMPQPHTFRQQQQQQQNVLTDRLTAASPLRPRVGRQQSPWQAAGSVQAEAAAEARSPVDPVMVTAAGVFADWDSQDAADVAPELADTTQPRDLHSQLSTMAKTQVPVAQPQGGLEPSRPVPSSPVRPQTHSVEVQSGAAAPDQLDSSTLIAPGSQALGCVTQQPSKQQRDCSPVCQTRVSQTATDPRQLSSLQVAGQSALNQASSVAAGADKGGRPYTERDPQPKPVPQAVKLPVDSSKDGNVTSLQVCSQQCNAEDDDFGACDDADNWGWQPTQGNFGYQDAFGASQPSQGFGLADGWAHYSKAAWLQQQAEANKPIVIASLPVKGQATSQQVRQTASASDASPGSKHVPFSNKRIAVLAINPQIHIKQAGAAAPAQLPEAQALPVRSRPLPKQGSAFKHTKAGEVSPAHLDVCPVAAVTITAADVRPSGSVMPTRQAKSPLAHSRSTHYGKRAASVVDEPVSKHGDSDSAPNAATTSSPQAIAVATSSRQDTTAAAVSSSSWATAVADTSRPATTAGGATGNVQATGAAGRGATAGRTAEPTAGATAGTNATSPAGAIFGPHIAGPVSSQSHVRKKLCLRLGPRQPDAASDAATKFPPDQSKSQSHDRLRKGCAAPAASVATSVSLPKQSKSQDDGKLRTEKQSPNGAPTATTAQDAPSNEQDKPASHALFSPSGTHLSALSPAASTPAGKLQSTHVSLQLFSRAMIAACLQIMLGRAQSAFFALSVASVYQNQQVPAPK